MMRNLWTVLSVVFLSVLLLAADVDKRLATVRKAYVVPVDDLGDDAPVATCLADHLKASTPIEAVKTKDEADVVFKVKAHLPSATSRYALGALGGSPSADLLAELPDGTKLWEDGAKVRRGNTGTQVLRKGAGEVGSIECGLADELINTLRDAMRKARDAK